ncbi:MAG: beta-Ala-His dipeptidase [Oscillospiraceae bacterium]
MENAERVLHYFSEISRIPRESGDEQGISDYLVSFAKEHKLEFLRDAHLNVIIKKPATIANCTCAPVIIQGHVDMVYVREEGCTRPYEDGIALLEKDGWITADGTTLGADNGFAVAYALALLESKDIKHPDLEAVFTVSEEVGLIGAEMLDCTPLKGKYFLNLDSEQEGVFVTSCAGATRNELKLPVWREAVSNCVPLTIHIGGLRGGHSGIEINTGRANAITLMGRVLAALDDKIHLCKLSSSGKMNAIANNAEALVFVNSTHLNAVEAIIQDMEKVFKHELLGRDEVSISAACGAVCDASCYTEKSRKTAVNALILLPSGIVAMSHNIDGLVETSANPGYIENDENYLIIHSSVRSSVGSRKSELVEHYAAIASLCGGESSCFGDYPQWEYRANSPLRELAMDTYRELFKKEPIATALHAGLECGFFDMRIEGLDLISFGPDQKGVHTPEECANIASIENVWKLILRLLERLGSK